ncbi:MAG: CPBP family intramembrane glutamic endopeptidase [Terriglobales bacterium]
METSALVQSAPDRYTRVASWTHTIALLAVLGGWALLAKMLAEQMRAASNPNRVRAYAVTTLMEWLVFGFVVWGVRRSGASVLLVVGERWRSARRVLRDLGVAAGFWVVAVALLWVFSKLLGIDSEGRNMQFILPHGGVEIAVWIVLSVTAGICEETIFRGYLQRQFIALTRSAPAGILLSAAAFGAAHAYQGWRLVVLISLFGAMFGILAYWRGSVRPGMMAHAWQDSLGGIIAALAKH